MTKKRPSETKLPPPETTLLTRLEACAMARMGLSTFDRRVAAGVIQIRKHGHLVMVERSELERYMRETHK